MKIDDETMRQKILIEINNAVQSPSAYTVKIHHEKSGSDSDCVRNTLMINVKIRMKVTAFKEDNTTLIGIFDTITDRNVSISKNRKEANVLQINTEMINNIDISILVLPSIRCITESAG